MASAKFIHATWPEIQRLCEEVAEQVRRSGFKPDVIVAVGRGGFPPARIISDVLDVRRVASITVEYYRAVGETKAEPRVVFPLNADVRGKRVLIVDDVADTGHSLLAVKKVVEEAGASEVRVATLHYKPWSVIKPDYYARETDAWVIYAWERWETVRDLAARMEAEGKDADEIVAELVRIGFEEEFVRKVLGSGRPRPADA